MKTIKVPIEEQIHKMINESKENMYYVMFMRELETLMK